MPRSRAEGTLAMRERTVAILLLALVVAGAPSGSVASAEGDLLVDAVNSVVPHGAREETLTDEAVTQVAQTACTALGAVTGRALTDVLQTGYRRLERDYDAAAAVFASPQAYRDFLDAERRLLSAQGFSETATEDALTLIERARAPEAQGLTASYSVKLHAGEINTVVCEVYRRRSQGRAASERDRRLVHSAVRGLLGLAVIAAGNSEAAREAESGLPVAAASTAVGSIIVARAYSSLFR